MHDGLAGTDRPFDHEGGGLGLGIARDLDTGRRPSRHQKRGEGDAVEQGLARERGFRALDAEDADAAGAEIGQQLAHHVRVRPERRDVEDEGAAVEQGRRPLQRGVQIGEPIGKRSFRSQDECLEGTAS